MRRIRGRAVAAGLMLCAVLAGSAPALAVASQVRADAQARAERWRVVQWLPRNSGLEAVAAVSRNDAWAVGSVGRDKAAVFYWDGKTWTRIAIAGLDPRLTLTNVEATSAADVWIFGSMAGTGEEVVLRFDGTSWSSVPAPAYSLDATQAVVLGADDAWWDESGLPYSTIWHWNGAAWSAQSVPGSITDIAGAGHHLLLATQRRNAPARTSILRWTGSGWQDMAFPDTARLYWPQVAAAPDGQAWVQAAPKSGQWSIYHWTGQSWRQVKVPGHVGRRSVAMTNVMTFDGHDGIWSEGTVHWNGRNWIVPSVSPKSLTIWAMQAPVASIPGTRGTWGIGLIDTSHTSRPKYRYFFALEGIRV